MAKQIIGYAKTGPVVGDNPIAVAHEIGRRDAKAAMTPNDMNDKFVEELLFVVAQLQRDGIANRDILASLRAMGTA